MTEENSWIDFSNVTPWEETISALEDIFASFHIGIQAAGMGLLSRFHLYRKGGSNLPSRCGLYI